MSNDFNRPPDGAGSTWLDNYLGPTSNGQDNQAGALLDDLAMANSGPTGPDTADPLSEYGIIYDPNMDSIDWSQLQANADMAGNAPVGDPAGESCA